MKVEMKNWEVERIKEIVSDVLELWAGDIIEVSNYDNDGKISMSIKTFLEDLDEALRK